MTAAWQPIFPNGREQLVTEGFPAWLRTPLVPWFRSRLSPHSDYFPSDALTEFLASDAHGLGFHQRQRLLRLPDDGVA